MGAWMNRAFADIEIGAAKAKGVAALRGAIHKDGRLDSVEILELFSLHKSGAPPADQPDWPEFFIEAVSEYFALAHEVPTYHAEELKPNWLALFSKDDRLGFKDRLDRLGVSASDADLLVEAVSVNGDILDPTEVKLFTNLFSRAVTYPKSFRNFVWRAVSATIMADMKINDDELALIQAIVMGPGGLDGIAINVDEAEALFILDKTLPDASKAAGWAEFFGQAIGSYFLFGGATPDVLSHEERLWLAGKLHEHESLGTKAVLDFIGKFGEGG